MKYFIGSVILSFLLISCNDKSTRAETDLIQNNLNGQIKSIEQFTQPIDSGHFNKDTSIMFFNSEGYLDSSFINRSNSGYAQKTIYERDENFYLTKERYFNSNSEQTGQRDYFYENNLLSKYTSEYGDRKSSGVYEYDENDSLTSGKFYSEEKLQSYFVSTHEHVMDSHITTKEFYSDNNELRTRFTNEYSDDLVTIKSKIESFSQISKTRSYNSTYQSKYHLNERHDITLIEMKLNKEPVAYTFLTYSYDENENWIKMKTQNEFKEDKIIIRKITYYDN